jgi:hypothetical protein
LPAVQRAALDAAFGLTPEVAPEHYRIVMAALESGVGVTRRRHFVPLQLSASDTEVPTEQGVVACHVAGHLWRRENAAVGRVREGISRR